MAAISASAASILINEQGSSAKKDRPRGPMRCLECYADALVLRHPKGSAAKAAAACTKPVLNAGDGVGEHPTQALLDVYTMRCELAAAQRRAMREGASSSPDSAAVDATEVAIASATASTSASATPTCGELLAGKSIALLGDLKHGRTVHSLATLIARNYPSARLRFVSPAQLAMPQEIKDQVAACGCTFTEHQDLEQIISDTDVLYVTRVQKERFASVEEYEGLKLRYIVTPAILAQAKPSLVLMHPLPRVGEINEACDTDLVRRTSDRWRTACTCAWRYWHS